MIDRVEQVYLGSFYQWRDANLVLDPGLTLAVGPNGAGKSSILEAGGWVIWGKRIRSGRKLKDAQANGEFRVGEKHYGIHRGNGPTKLYLNPGGDNPADLSGQTDTQTQEAINAVFGRWETFLSTRIFSGQRGVTFGNQANADRQKVLLDLLPEVAGFETAANAARGALANSKDALAIASSKLDRAMAVLQEVRRSIEDNEGHTTSVIDGDVKALTDQIAKLREDCAKAEASEQKMRDLINDAAGELDEDKQAMGDLRGIANSLSTQQARIRDVASECPTCMQSVPDEHRARVMSEIGANMEEAQTAYETKATQVRSAAAEVSDMRDKERDLRAKASEVRNLIRKAEAKLADDRATQAEARAHAGEMEKLNKRAKELDADVATQQTVVEDAEYAHVLDLAVADVLGPRGARLRLMASALDQLTQATDEVLAAIGSDVRVKFGASKPKATGGESAQVHVKAYANGGICEYDDLSGGERVRIDVATLVALARTRTAGGILMFDEVFDPLDDAGLEGVAGLLQDMATERQILVISHNPRLVALMPRATVWQTRRGDDGRSEIAA